MHNTLHHRSKKLRNETGPNNEHTNAVLVKKNRNRQNTGPYFIQIIKLPYISLQASSFLHLKDV